MIVCDRCMKPDPPFEKVLDKDLCPTCLERVKAVIATPPKRQGSISWIFSGIINQFKK